MSIIYIYPEILACNRNRLGQKLASRREPHQIRPHYFEHKLMQRICQAFRFNGTRPETLRDSSWSWQYKSIFPFSSFFPFFKRLHHFASPKHVQHVLSGNSIPAKPGVRVLKKKFPQAVFVGNPATTTLCVWPLESLLPNPLRTFTKSYSSSKANW